MRLKRICRKICLFLIGFNLLIPVHFLLSTTDSLDLTPFRRLCGVIVTVSGILGSFYLLVISAKFTLTHFNKLLTIIINSVGLVYNIVLTVTSHKGNNIAFFWLITVYSVIIGLNECFTIVIDPVNIPFFLMGTTLSALLSSFYRFVNTGNSVDTGNSRTLLMVGLVVSVVVVILCIYGYGGSALFSIIGITRMTDFTLDNSDNKLTQEGEKYEKYLNDRIVHRIKNLEYEIILKPNLIHDYTIKNIINSKVKNVNKRDNKSNSIVRHNTNTSGNT